MKTYRELNTVTLSESDQITHPNPLPEYTLDTPASSIFTDFSKVEPLTLDLHVSVDDAKEIMKKSHVRSVLVIDSNHRFKGLLTINDVESRLPMSVAATAGIRRSDVTINDVMTPRDKLKAIPLTHIQSASIGDVLQTLKHEGTPHILVVNIRDHSIHGVISSSDIARRLNISVDISKRASNFKEVVGLIAAGQDF